MILNASARQNALDAHDVITNIALLHGFGAYSQDGTHLTVVLNNASEDVIQSVRETLDRAEYDIDEN